MPQKSSKSNKRPFGKRSERKTVISQRTDALNASHGDF